MLCKGRRAYNLASGWNDVTTCYKYGDSPSAMQSVCVKIRSGGIAMRSRFITFWGLVVCFLIAGTPLIAHHGENNYDTSKAVVLKGATVTKWLWINPHVIVQVDAKDAQGIVQHWSAEASSPSTLQLKGWSEASFKPGEASQQNHPGRWHGVARWPAGRQKYRGEIVPRRAENAEVAL